MNREIRSTIPKTLHDYVDEESINDNSKSKDPHRRSMEVLKESKLSKEETGLFGTQEKKELLIKKKAT